MSSRRTANLSLVISMTVIAIALVSTLQSKAQAINSFPMIDQQPQARNIILEWGTLISTQDRFFPQLIVVNQGDTVNLTFESNDTDGAHTFTIDAPTGPNGTTQITQLNETVPGQHIYYPPVQAGPQYGIKVTSHATGCHTMGRPVQCNTTGGCSINGGPLTTCIGSWMLKKGQNETASVQASTTFGPLRAPGVYEFSCTYHTAIGMNGYLIVLPNKGYNATA
jgi:plastocyanin